MNFKPVCILSVLFSSLFLISCESSSSGDEESCNSPWICPDEQGRETKNNYYDQGPEMLIISPQALVEEWEEYAYERSLTGVFTQVRTIQTILEQSEGDDAAAKLRNYLRIQYETNENLRFILLGGDADDIPYRRVANEIDVSVLGEHYQSNAPSQLYFSNLYASWDGDEDGIGGELNEDFSLEVARNNQLAVGRLPLETSQEFNNYFHKYERYLQSTEENIYYPLLFSDIAFTSDFTGAIDGAEGIEPTVTDFFPQRMQDNAHRLYVTDDAIEKYDAEKITYQKIRQSLNDGYGFLFHNGHGSHNSLASSIDKDVIRTFDNELPNILLSCACLAGNFADMDGGFQLQDNDDSAGEIYLTDYYGGIAYAGSTAVGLGPWGGSQFLHAMSKAVFEEGLTSLGEAFNYGRAHLASIDYDIMGSSSGLVEVTDEREWWTQHVLILLGDPSLRIRTEQAREVEVILPETYTPGYQTIEIQVKDMAGEPVSDAIVSFYKLKDIYLKSITDQDGKASFSFIPYSLKYIEVGVSGADIVPTSAVIIAEQ
ncbi:MAG: C25 family cysteine peptidase [Myxococcota bacterium]